MAAELSAGEILVSSSPETVACADRVVLPGVGSFADCRSGLAKDGLDEALVTSVIDRGVPFLGICVGMQLMASIGFEHGKTAGFGWIPGEVRRIKRRDSDMKIPHMGWNDLEFLADHPIFGGFAGGTDVYFVHSYQLVPDSLDHLIACTDYGGEVTAAVAAGNLAGTQFHPEKSQAAGLGIIGNFLSWNPG